MESIINNNSTPNDTLAQPLQSALVVPMDSIKGKTASNGHRFCKLIDKGAHSKLAASVAVEVPAVQIPKPAQLTEYPAIADYLRGALEQLQGACIKSLVISGARTVQYSELSLAHLEQTAACLNEACGIGQLSELGIKQWFDSNARELVIVALADKLGISETANDADIKRLEQIANQLRDNLAKLSGKKPIHFDERVRNALNMALSASDTGDSMTQRLSSKLNAVVSNDDMLLNLGM